jgi:hypothetical protein
MIGSSWASQSKWYFMYRILFTLWNSGSTSRSIASSVAAEIALCKPFYSHSFRNSWQPSINSMDLHSTNFWLWIDLLRMLIWNSTSYQMTNETKKLKSFNWWGGVVASWAMSGSCLSSFLARVISASWTSPFWYLRAFTLAIFASQQVSPSRFKVKYFTQSVKIFQQLTEATNTQ